MRYATTGLEAMRGVAVLIGQSIGCALVLWAGLYLLMALPEVFR